jgi:hypothetical protein
MKKTVYIETSIFSYLTARPTRDVIAAARQAITVDWWDNSRERFDGFVSEAVLIELKKGDPIAAKKRIDVAAAFEVLATTEEALKLAEKLLAAKLLPRNSDVDALHIAVAAISGMDYLLTWNFKHINNATTRAGVVSLIASEGLQCPVLCSPEGLLGA